MSDSPMEESPLPFTEEDDRSEQLVPDRDDMLESRDPSGSEIARNLPPPLPDLGIGPDPSLFVEQIALSVVKRMTINGQSPDVSNGRAEFNLDTGKSASDMFASQNEGWGFSAPPPITPVSTTHAPVPLLAPQPEPVVEDPAVPEVIVVPETKITEAPHSVVYPETVRDELEQLSIDYQGSEDYLDELRGKVDPLVNFIPEVPEVTAPPPLPFRAETRYATSGEVEMRIMSEGSTIRDGYTASTIPVIGLDAWSVVSYGMYLVLLISSGAVVSATIEPDNVGAEVEYTGSDQTLLRIPIATLTDSTTSFIQCVTTAFRLSHGFDSGSLIRILVSASSAT